VGIISNPVEALIFFRLLLSNCLNWNFYCDDHSSLSIRILQTEVGEHAIIMCMSFILLDNADISNWSNMLIR